MSSREKLMQTIPSPIVTTEAITYDNVLAQCMLLIASGATKTEAIAAARAQNCHICLNDEQVFAATHTREEVLAAQKEAAKNIPNIRGSAWRQAVAAHEALYGKMPTADTIHAAPVATGPLSAADQAEADRCAAQKRGNDYEVQAAHARWNKATRSMSGRRDWDHAE
jgi:hypothetical protein